MVTLYANVYVKHSVFSAQQHMLSALYAIAVHSSVCLSITRVDQSKTAEFRIMQVSPYSSPMPLLFAI